MADESGTKVNTYKYSPRGVRVLDGTDEKVKQPHQFTGGYRDETGLYHFAARYYDPNIGRFTSQDPSGQEKNPYLYAEGDPVNRIDPTGLLTGSVSGEVCFGVCIGGGGKTDGEDFKPTVSFGFGSPGASGEISADTGDMSSGLSGEVGCGWGPGNFKVSGDKSGANVGYGTGASTGKCSVRGQYTF